MVVALGVVEEYSDEVIPEGSYVPTDVIGELPLDSAGVVSAAPGVVGEIPLDSDDMAPVAEAEVPGS